MKNAKLIKGRKILLVSDKELISAKGYKLYRRDLSGGTWKYYSKVIDPLKSFLSRIRPLSRLFRAELNKLYVLPDGTQLCIARKGIFRKSSDSKVFLKCYTVKRGSRPMNICYDEDSGNLYFGEYFINYEKEPVHIYCSENMGMTWNIVYTFEKGMINHIHGIFKDPYTKDLWVATGDREDECILCHTSDGFKSIDIVYRGGQDFRTCVLFFYEEFVVIATDSEYQQNYICKIDRKSYDTIKLQPVQGSVIGGVQCGRFCALCSDVEPSKINKDKNAYIWVSYDGLKWEQLYSQEKDCFSARYFQYGMFEFPNYKIKSTDTLYATGKALKHCDGDTLVFNMNEINKQ